MREKYKSRTLEGHYLRLPSMLRSRFDQDLTAGPKAQTEMFDGELRPYERYLIGILNNVLCHEVMKDWMLSSGIDAVTWHYKTRHSDYVADAPYSWISGQVITLDAVDQSSLQPFLHQPSPYIGIFGSSVERELSGNPGPVCFGFSSGTGHQDPDTTERDWCQSWSDAGMSTPMLVPRDVSRLLTEFTRESGARQLLNRSQLLELSSAVPSFVKGLAHWLKEFSPKVESMHWLNVLFASTTVTRLIIKQIKEEGALPRSTFVCPTYVASEEVGGMAFACRGFVQPSAAIIAETIAETLLGHLRLREDAHAHAIAQQYDLADKTKQFLLHRVIHDLRHPADLLRQAISDQRAMLLTVEGQVKDLTSELDKTLIFISSPDPRAVLRGGGIQLNQNRDTVSEAVEDFILLYKRRFAEIGKRIRVDDIPRDWTISIDSGIVREIFNNLLSNGLEHGMMNGGTEVHVCVAKARKEYLFYISNDGPAIPVALRKTLFEPRFHTVEGQGGGRARGQGLSIARILARAHGGELKLVRNAPWRVCFRLTLPWGE